MILPTLMLVGLLAGCASLPSLEERESSEALSIQQAQETRLGQSLAARLAAHPGLAGIYPLPDAREAFATRVLLADMADETLDVQYYIWRADTTGLILLASLMEAADRGVRVRLLLDDMNTSGMDPILRAADAHPNLDVRLFNPFVYRSARWYGFLTDFSRLNRRMHNKSFTADNMISVIGGRNVGDEYFGATEDVAFSDLDVMVAGDVVREVSVDFDRYWASESAYPAASILGEADETDLDEWSQAIEAVWKTERARTYVKAILASDFVHQTQTRTLPVEWAKTRMFSDAPGKGLGQVAEDGLLSTQLSESIGEIHDQFNLVSPYFIPTDTGVAALNRMESLGVEVRVLTNSLSATDVALVHSGYARYRKALLEGGVELYEMKALPGHGAMAESISNFGASATSLHAKTFEVDGTWLFVGSFNFDPRSTHLNTELGFLIQSPSLAAKLETLFDETVPRVAYRVQLDEDGDLYWIDGEGEDAERWDVEPETGWFKRFNVGFFSLLPIEGML
ncbi:phospholipase D family protein [Marinobacter nanhaiticus D15-8W]|uniref:Phospholipase D family protein n=2 Tax=Marinobacter TaxID=2742 RepID=N6WUY7_9GAMM|nr:phospholipase D family protein [Marinobacter nanhaiticus D15-8W]BES69476.1 phospholipase D family protein [Marinobacter nanhaiticus D15-8W]